MANELRDLILARKAKDESKADKEEITKATTIGLDNPNDAQVFGRPGFIWVRENTQQGAVFQVFNQTVKRLVGLPVLIAKDRYAPFRRVVIGIDWDALPNTSYTGQSYGLIYHADSHEWQDTLPGLDAMTVYPRAIAAFRVFPDTGIKVGISKGYYIHDKALLYYVGQTGFDLSGSIPAAGNNVGVLVYYDFGDGTVHEITGAEIAQPNEPIYPTVPDDVFPLAYLKLYDTLTQISETDIVVDLRTQFTFTSQGGHVIQKDGVPIADEPNLNFIGPGVTVVDNPGNNSTDVTIIGDVNPSRIWMFV